MQDQEAYSIHKPVRHKFQRTRIVVAGRDNQWDADLADMQDVKGDNDGIAYLLIAIDLMSRFTWVRPLKTKSANEVKAAFQDIFSKGRKPDKLRTDQGKEFNNRVLQKYLKDERCQVFSPHRMKARANYAERVIKTIKSKIIRFLTHNNTRRYIDQTRRI